MLALQPLIEYYGLKDEFPVSRQLISRSLEVARPKRLYFVTTQIFDVIIRDNRELLKIAATGLKVRFGFGRAEHFLPNSRLDLPFTAPSGNAFSPLTRQAEAVHLPLH